MKHCVACGDIVTTDERYLGATRAIVDGKPREWQQTPPIGALLTLETELRPASVRFENGIAHRNCLAVPA